MARLESFRNFNWSDRRQALSPADILIERETRYETNHVGYGSYLLHRRVARYGPNDVDYNFNDNSEVNVKNHFQFNYNFSDNSEDNVKNNFEPNYQSHDDYDHKSDHDYNLNHEARNQARHLLGRHGKMAA